MGTNIPMQCHRYLASIDRVQSLLNYSNISGTYRDETAPIAVGSTLAVAAICTVVGYGLWR
jgi:hypothetical protein